MTRVRRHLLLFVLLLSSAASFLASPAALGEQAWIADAAAALEDELIAEHGEEQRARVQQGLDQVASFWRAQDGGREAFETFVRRNFAGDTKSVDIMFGRFEKLLEHWMVIHSRSFSLSVNSRTWI